MLRAHLATLADATDLIQVGAYKAGTSREIDEALARKPSIEAFARQSMGEQSAFEEAVAGLGATVRGTNLETA